MKINNFPKYLNIKDLIYSRPIANSSVIVEKKLIRKLLKNIKMLIMLRIKWIMIMLYLGRTLFINKVLVEINIEPSSRTNMNFLKNLKSLFFIYKKTLNFNIFQIIYFFIWL